MQTHIPLTKELLLVGGGHAHALVLRMWGMRPLPGVRVTVVNPGPTAPYTGMLPGFIAGHYERDELDIDLVRLARFAGARLILDSAIGISPDDNTVRLSGGRILPYHALSVDIGITSNMPRLLGFSAHGIPAKPLDVYARKWTEFRQKVAAGELSPDVVVIGAGVGGVELALAMHHALKTDGHGTPKITLIESDIPLKGMGNTARKALLSDLSQRNIHLLTGQQVDRVDETAVHLPSHAPIASNFTLGVAGAKPHGWLEHTGLMLTDGYIDVGKTLQTAAYPQIFAVGDCANMTHAPRAKAGVFAVRQAPVLYHNLQAILAGETLRQYHPQRDYLKLISLGKKSAVADKWRLKLKGAALWRWKNQIDQRFMAQFHQLKPMPAPALPARHAKDVMQVLGKKPLCGGCGSKVGALALRETLRNLPASMRNDVLSVPGDDAAILAGNGDIRQTITLDHLRAFTSDPWLMSRIAAIHALGDIWAMGAQPQVALSTLILPRMSPEMQEIFLKEIMSAAQDVFGGLNCDIVGGHTSIGSELTIGFTVTGLTQRPITLAGAQDGDQLILTKPIGTGTILAGEMAMQAKGGWVAGALASMARPQADAARLLTGAHAMTDVTGFGLAGHAKGIATASGLGVTLNVDAIPYLPGAIALNQMGVRSTIYQDNRQNVPELTPGDDPRADLLFDPQTAGGLLAAIPADQSEEILSKLRSLRYEANMVGVCRSDLPTGHITLT